MNKITKKSVSSLAKNSKRIVGLIWKGMPMLSLGIAVAVLLGTVTGYGRQAAQAFLINELIVRISGKAAPLLAFAMVLFVALFIIPQVFYWVRSYLSRIFRFRLEEYVDFLFFEKRGALDVAQWEDPKKNDMLQIVSENEYRLYNSTQRLFDILENIITVGIAAAIIAVYKWWTLPVLVIATAPELWISIKHGRRVWGIMQSRSETRRRYVAFVNHFYELPRMVELKIFQNVSYFLENIRTLYRGFQLEEKKNERKRFFYGLGTFLVVSAGIAVIAVAFIGDVISGRMNVGAFLFVVGSAISFRGALSGLFNVIGDQHTDNHFITEIFQFLDLAPALPQPARPSSLIISETPEVIFDNVSFAYPGSSTFSLDRISFSLSKGEKIALVGRNGSGKTTLVKLLCRFYDPTAGRIIVGGADLKEIDLKAWYAKLGILFQEFSHYAMSVEELISLGCTSVPRSHERVHEAGVASGVDDFVNTWDDGYKQMLGKQFSGGEEPSIGQWQRLALARVFYRKAQIIVLDEPTASVDAEGEAEIFEQLEKLSADQSIILISHRLSTVRKASKILVLNEGHLAESGSHAELVKIPNGIYARLFALQAKWYE